MVAWMVNMELMRLDSGDGNDNSEMGTNVDELVGTVVGDLFG